MHVNEAAYLVNRDSAYHFARGEEHDRSSPLGEAVQASRQGTKL